jgi:hypothetical protein
MTSHPSARLIRSQGGRYYDADIQNEKQLRCSVAARSFVNSTETVFSVTGTFFSCVRVIILSIVPRGICRYSGRELVGCSE